MSADDNAKLAQDFIAGWERLPYEDGMRAAYATYLADDSIYENSGLRPCTSRAETLQMVDDIVHSSGVVSVRSEIRTIAAQDDVVFTERIDNNLDADGNVVHALPICGMMRFRDGKIVEWREYFHVGDTTTGDGYLTAAAVETP